MGKKQDGLPRSQGLLNSQISSGARGSAVQGLQMLKAGKDATADVFVCDECSSTFDLAWDLCAAGSLPVWGSVLALRQTGGRGQLRRPWYSPAGNLYVSFRLPDFFLKQEAAPLLTAFLLIRAFVGLGLPLCLKWPNDLVLFEADQPASVQPEWGGDPVARAGRSGRPGKLGGLLLEERNGILLAGLGLNCTLRPDTDILREDAALQPAVLPENFLPRQPIPLWLELVSALILLYDQLVTTTSVCELLRRTEEFLLWKGSEVQVRDHYENGSVVTGVLAGLTELGGLRLLVRPDGSTPSNGPGELSLYSGSIKPIY
ncbi:MAG: hypothetical protein LBV80_04450 [Deltaproteobacteria bacterium]|nr:hypothetical protein [Deltaproteobacteria bacterium]